jgi:hypothetical protein
MQDLTMTTTIPIVTTTSITATTITTTTPIHFTRFFCTHDMMLTAGVLEMNGLPHTPMSNLPIPAHQPISHAPQQSESTGVPTADPVTWNGRRWMMDGGGVGHRVWVFAKRNKDDRVQRGTW